jgi:hypothetical protein
VHQIYQREKVDDVAPWRDAVQFPEVGALLAQPSSRRERLKQKKRGDEGEQT